MPSLDIFNNNAFSMVSLTDAINKMPFIPGKVGQLGLFVESGVATTTIMIEERQGSLSLIETSPRGAPAVQNLHNKRKVRSLVVPHIALEDTIMADEVQNVRAFGSENLLDGVQNVVSQRLLDMSNKHDATLEHLRIGALKGQILDADGTTVIYDLFDQFGVTAYDEVDFDLTNASPTTTVRQNCSTIIRQIQDELGAAPYDHIHALCSSTFFDQLTDNPQVTEAYKRYQESEFLRSGVVNTALPYGGVIFEEYRGKVGAIDFIEDGKAHFFPVGTPGLFRQYNAPADFIETVNTIGLPRYAKQAVDDEFGRWVKLHTQTNPLPICTRPRTLIQASSGA